VAQRGTARATCKSSSSAANNSWTNSDACTHMRNNPHPPSHPTPPHPTPHTHTAPRVRRGCWPMTPSPVIPPSESGCPARPRFLHCHLRPSTARKACARVSIRQGWTTCHSYDRWHAVNQHPRPTTHSLHCSIPPSTPPTSCSGVGQRWGGGGAGQRRRPPPCHRQKGRLLCFACGGAQRAPAQSAGRSRCCASMHSRGHG
jgi:hypothetical protein